jgi:WD40 repeat protein
MRLEGFRMFGKHQPGEATILDAQSHYLGEHSIKMEYVLEVHPPTGQAFRATASYDFYSGESKPQVGEVVNVKYHPQSLKVELDLKDDPRYGKKRALLEHQSERQEAQARRDALLATPPGMSLSSDNLLSTLTGHTDTVWAVAWSPDGRLLASGGDNTIRIWNLASSKPLPLTTLEEDPEDGVVKSIAWSPDGRLVAFCGTNTHLWDATTGERYPPLIPDPRPDYNFVNSVAWSPNSRSLASSYDDGTIILWDAFTRMPLATLKGSTDGVFSVAWSPDGRLLASASEDKMVRLWDVHTSQIVAVLSAQPYLPVSLAWSPDGRLLVCGGDSVPRIWDASTRKQLLYKWVGRGMIWATVWSSDGRLATASTDQTVRLWDVHKGKHLATLNGHTKEVYSVAWSPDGCQLASGSEDKTVRLWRVE